MSSNGIEGLIVETHNWGKSVAFWRDLGYDLKNSLVLRHPAGGPFIYLVEQPETQNLEVLPVVAIEDSTTFTPPAAASAQHNGFLMDGTRRRNEARSPVFLTSAFRIPSPRRHIERRGEGTRK